MPCSGRFAAVLVSMGLTACTAAAPTSPKIVIDFTNVNAEGLRGPANGLRAVHYEFCIPAAERYEAEVRGIDATARFHRGSRGRIGCSRDEVLALGSTHQSGYREVLNRLAALHYITRIQETHFE